MYSHKISCKKEKLVEIRGFVHDVLKQMKLPDLEVNTMVLAVDEVCANLIIHSHQCNPKDHLELRITPSSKTVTFEIVDYGMGFNIDKYEEPKLHDIVKSRRKGGIGLMLVRRIMDKVEYIKGSNHNIYRLSKNL
ncbi:MAG TPA: anti-sigma factor [Cytophagales bacterium]|nr:anti-sigma factor [Cytophagales bacterium]